ncbi:hypothetical protein ACEUA8_01475 [Aeromonas veronii]
MSTRRSVIPETITVIPATITGNRQYGKLDFTSALNTIANLNHTYVKQDGLKSYDMAKCSWLTHSLKTIGFYEIDLTPQQIKLKQYDLMVDHHTLSIIGKKIRYYRLCDNAKQFAMTYNQEVIPVHLLTTDHYDPNNILHVINKTANVFNEPASTKSYGGGGLCDYGYTTEWLHKIKTTMTPYYVGIKQIEAYDPIGFMCMTPLDVVDALHSLPVDYNSSCFLSYNDLGYGRPQDVYVDHFKWLYSVCKHEGIAVEIIQFVDLKRLNDNEYIYSICEPDDRQDY